MTVVDSFTPTDYESLILADKEPGSTATLLLPSFPGRAHPNLAVVAGKGGTIYLVDQSSLGGYSPTGPGRVLREINIDNEFYGSPSYANGKVHYQAVGDVLRSFSVRLDSTSPESIPLPGTAPATSSDGAADGIVRTLQVDGYQTGAPAVLHAYDASNLADDLFNSSTLPANRAGGAVKFVTPTIADGRAFVGLSNDVDIYGLLAGPRRASR